MKVSIFVLVCSIVAVILLIIIIHYSYVETRTLGATDVKVAGMFGHYEVETSVDLSDSVIESLSQIPGVASIERTGRYKARFTRGFFFGQKEVCAEVWKALAHVYK